MDVVSACPLRVASIVWQPEAGPFVLTVAVVVSYTLAPGESLLATTQDAPNEADGHWDDDENRSLHVASDLAPFKPRADVFLVGHAYAPGGEPVPSLMTRLIVGDIDKSIAVYGDRVFTLDGELREPARFQRMPLRWERTGGGPHTSNPVGVRADAPHDGQGMTPLPNLLPPGMYVANRGDFIEPIGYAPLAPSWPGRLSKLHHHGSAWDHHRWSRRPLPRDIDSSYFNAAPPDQQLNELRSNERIVLENLHPDHQRLVTSLKPVVPNAVVEREGRSPEPLRLRCDTLSIDVDRGRCSLTWRGAAPLRHPAEAGRVIVTTGEPSGSSRPSSMPPLDGPRRVQTLVGSQPLGSALPFAPSVGAPQSPRRSPRSQPAPDTPSWGLPFKTAIPPPLPPPTRPPPRSSSALDVDPLASDRLRAGNALPFSSGARALSALPAPPALPTLQPASRDAWSPSPAELPLPTANSAASNAPPPMSNAPSTRPSAPIRKASPLPPRPTDEPPAPPPMIGPLATPDMFLKKLESSVPPAPLPPPPPPPAVEAAPAGPELPLDAYPIGRCAAIGASIARRPADHAAILEGHDLAPERWAALDQHWADAIRKETGRGRAKLLCAYDGAYVGQLEAERGPIGVTEYARIVIAAERGAEGPALADLGMPSAASLRIQRVWLRKIAEDAILAANARKEVEAAREEEE